MSGGRKRLKVMPVQETLSPLGIPFVGLKISASFILTLASIHLACILQPL
jgi:hypothetical protein